MIRALRILLLIVTTVFIAIAIPRESGRERSIAVVWAAPVPARVRNPENYSQNHVVGVVGKDYWALIDPDTGLSPVSGLKAGRFTMFDGGYINQSPVVPRWVVQDWNGAALRIVENAGVPRFYADMLVQFGARAVTIATMPSGDPVTVPGDVRLSAFAAAFTPDLGRFFVTGTIRGEVALYRLEERAPVRLSRRVIDSSRPEPIYAAGLLVDDRSAAAPTLVALHGSSRQYLEVMEVADEGSLRSLTRLEVPARMRVKGPTEIVDLGDFTVATALRDSVAVWNVREDRFTPYPIAGVTRLVGGGVESDHTTIVVERERGWAMLLVERDAPEPYLWMFSTGTVLGISRGRVLVQVADDVIAIEATL